MKRNPALDLIVVGAGVMGCATAYHTAREGRRVLLPCTEQVAEYRYFFIGRFRGTGGPARQLGRQLRRCPHLLDDAPKPPHFISISTS